jgi:DNA-nicking Smr family endonuclease
MAKQRTSKSGAPAPPEEDAQAFRAAVRDVKPLAHAGLPAGLSKPKTPVRRRRAAAIENLDATMPLIASAAVAGHAGAGDAPPPGAPGETLTFQRPGVRTQVVRRLRRGLIPVDAELDLHGLAQTAARDLLALFLAESRNAGRRCVRIIHGKGYRSGARGPILKTAVDMWLRRHADVMAFTSARPVDGGTGALYVLLRA